MSPGPKTGTDYDVEIAHDSGLYQNSNENFQDDQYRYKVEMACEYTVLMYFGNSLTKFIVRNKGDGILHTLPHMQLGTIEMAVEKGMLEH
ncbi:hypothetical protein VB005_01383 [Metarhizium brunneum]